MTDQHKRRVPRRMPSPGEIGLEVLKQTLIEPAVEMAKARENHAAAEGYDAF